MRPKIDLYMVKEILKILSQEEKLNFYEIARRVSLNNKKPNPNTITRYLRFLVHTGLVNRIEHSIISVEYQITEKGMQIHQALEQIPEIPEEALKPTPRSEYIKPQKNL